jgi:glyoxalase family protein
MILSWEDSAMSVLKGRHHITLCVGGVQEDYDFHPKLLGLHGVKKTVLLTAKLASIRL